MIRRYALVTTNDPQTVASYMPDAYEVEAIFYGPKGGVVVIGGKDVAGWTLDGYVIPRLASGLHWAHEIDLSHPIMKLIPVSDRRARGHFTAEMSEEVYEAVKAL